MAAGMAWLGTPFRDRDYAQAFLETSEGHHRCGPMPCCIAILTRTAGRATVSSVEQQWCHAAPAPVHWPVGHRILLTPSGAEAASLSVS
jgi:hypothetical protein